MTSSPELLRFFHSEAGEYLDAIEELVAEGESELDAGAFVAAARAMRGSATMARVPRIAEIAFTLERIGGSLREGELSWTAALFEELRATISELRPLIAATRWTTEEEGRAARRLAALQRFTASDERRPTPQAAVSTAPIFIALQTAAIGADLDAFVSDSRNRTLLDDVISRVRSLRGIAGIADHPPLSDVADTIERALRALAPDALLGETEVELLRAGAGVFRRASADLRARGRINLASGEIARFAHAAEAPPPPPAEPERVVRIDDLFYEDTGPHLVKRGQPKGTPESRFRNEVVTRAEHLRRLLAEARSAGDPISRERASRDLRLNLERLETFAQSFNAQQVASFFGDAARRQDFHAAALDGLESGANALLVPNASVEEMEQRLAALDRVRYLTPAPASAAEGAGTAVAATVRTSGKALRAMLETGLAGLRPLAQEPLSEPAQLDNDQIVPIETLFYRGRAALSRALELRDAMRARGAVDDESLQELYDLLDLARTE